MIFAALWTAEIYFPACVGGIHITLAYLLSPLSSVCVAKVGLRVTSLIGVSLHAAGFLLSSFVQSLWVGRTLLISTHNIYKIHVYMWGLFQTHQSFSCPSVLLSPYSNIDSCLTLVGLWYLYNPPHPNHSYCPLWYRASKVSV